jgi:hypothetical protein
MSFSYKVKFWAQAESDNIVEDRKIKHMKVKILYLLLFIFLACGQKTKSEGNVPEKDSIPTKTNFQEFEDKTIFEGDTLNGKVKTITQNSYGKYCDNSDVIYTFNEYGLQVRRQGFGQDIFEYYKENKVIKSSICFADNGKEYTRNEYLYDERGNLIKHVLIDLLNEKFNLSDNTITEYFYNDKNKLIEKREGREKIIYQYDEYTDCVIEEYYYEDFLRKKIENKYINHRLEETLSWRLFEGVGSYTKKTYSYNTDGTLKSITHYASDTKDFFKQNSETTFYYYTYDNKNRLVKFQEINNNYYEKTITYSNFDVKGNWQLKYTNDNGRKSKIKRRFEYFDN